MVLAAGNRRSKRRNRSATLRSEINITPFVDVILVLLIIFMVSEPLLLGNVPINLPKANAAPAEAATKPITISLDGAGHFYLETERYNSAQELIEHLSDTAQQIFIKGDKQAPYAEVLKFLALLQQHNFTKISLLSQQ